MAKAEVRTIQEALLGRGFDPGDVDGVWGRRTIAAVKLFQAAQGLKIDGIVGPATAAKLFDNVPLPAAAGSVTLPWFEEAKRLAGTKEVLGTADNPVIMEWAADLDLKYSGDDIPWCGLFTAHCVGATLPEEALPANPLGARQWARFGTETQPRLGAVLVFWRESKASGKGHVGFYVAEDPDGFLVLGGNQSNTVCLTWLGKDCFLNARWPGTAASLTSAAVYRARNLGESVDALLA